jgi:hypothetical protein
MNVRIWLLAVAVPVICVPVRSAEPASYYVDNSAGARCSDAPNFGTQTNPWCTISYSIKQIAGGDTVYVKAGSYHEDIYISGPAGTAANSTVIRSYPGSTVTIVGDGIDSGRVKIANTSYITLDGFEVTKFNQGIYVEHGDHIAILNNNVHHVGQEAIHVMGNSSFVRIQGNVVHDTKQWQYNGEGIYIGTGSTGDKDNTNNITVRSNTIYNTTDEAVELKPGTYDSVIEGNMIYNVTTDPAFPREWGAIEVGQAVGGVQSWASSPNHIVKNNVVRSSKTGIRLGTGSSAFNNVIYDTAAPYYGIFADNIANDSYVRKIYHNTVDLPAARAIVIARGTSDVRNNIGPNTSDNMATNDAYYVDKRNANYRLAAGSAPIDRGVDLGGAVPTDASGKSRQSSKPDMGAYEFVPGDAPAVANATQTAATCSQASVQTAIDTARNGDVVSVPAGTCTWTGTVKINGKSIVLQGAGIDKTIIVDSIESANTLEAEISNENPALRITGFTFNANGIKKTSEYAEIAVGAANDTLDKFRIDHVKISNVWSRGILIAMNGFDMGGVIDSCEIIAPYDGPAQGVTIEGSGPENRKPFSRPFTIGTNHAIYVEDCAFNYSYQNDGVQDAYTGARYVFRNNKINGTFISHHGADSGDGAGVASFEIYNNTFNSASVGNAPNAGNIAHMMFFRSGTGVVFGNGFTTSGTVRYTDGITITNYRSWQSYGVWGKCDGSSPWDENQPGKQGYACLDQVGHFFTPNQGGSNVLKPLYLWANTLNGSPTNAGVQDLSPALRTLHMLENRDFYNQAASFNGTAGVGSGASSARPSNCTLFTAYFATDSNTLYQCSAPSQWSSYYTPYAYPHPLRGPAAPTGLTVLSVR